LNRCDRTFEDTMCVVGPALEAYETEFGFAGSAGHMTTSCGQVDEQATFRTCPDAGTARNVIDLFLLHNMQNTESRVLSIASFILATHQICASPPALAGPAEVERRTGITGTHTALQSYVAVIDVDVQRITSETLLVATPLTNVMLC